MSESPATQIRSFRLDAPLAGVFPLFTAEGERAWAPGWEPTILSGAAERGSAFVTRGHTGIETTWIVTDYRPSEGRVSYARLAQGSNIGLVDVVCTGRFYDFLEKRPARMKPDSTSDEGRWGIVRRQPIYEKDRMDPVDPAASLTLDPARLARFPEGYRHLAYLQSTIGFAVKDNLPGLRGPAVEKLYAEGRSWLAGSAKPGEPL